MSLVPISGLVTLPESNNITRPNSIQSYLHEVKINQTYGGSLDEHMWAAISTVDSGYALAGLTSSVATGGYQMWLVKTNATGNIEWNKSYGGNGYDSAISIISTADGGFALAGVTQSYGVGSRDMWLVKTNVSGDVEWNKTYGGTLDDRSYSIIVAPDGGYALAGLTESFGAGSWDMWLVKTNATGDIEWNKTYGGNGVEWVDSIISTPDGGYALAGTTESFGAGSGDMWLVKTNATGDIEWNRTYGGNGPEQAWAIISTPDGGYALAGATSSYGAGSRDMWLVKTTVTGDLEWNQTYGGNGQESAISIISTADGGYALAGGTESYGTGSWDMWLVKTNASGDLEWSNTYGGTGHDYAYSIISTVYGSYALAGTTSSYGAGNVDMWLVRISLQDLTTTTTTASEPLITKSESLVTTLPLPTIPLLTSFSLICTLLGIITISLTIRKRKLLWKFK